jgi:4-hydroxy-3-polyprenylbenzoate decarboxylase
MPFKNLGAFLKALKKAGDLHVVSSEVDSEYEAGEIAQRAVREGKPALLFTNVKGSKIPLAMNALATRGRIELALGRPPESVGEELVGFVERMKPPSLGALWQSRATVARGVGARVVKRGAGASQAVREPVDLHRLPVLRCWPGDGGRFFTWPMVLTHDPVTGGRNLGLYRLHQFDSATTGMHWQIQKGGGFHYHEAEKRGMALPVTVSLGADPCLMLSAVAPLPEGIDELAFAAFLRGAPTPLARAVAVDGAWAPAEAEIVLEGYVPPKERRMEGPFGDHFGHYSHAAPFPVFKVQAITRRKDAVYYASFVGKPPQEDKAIGEGVGAMMGPLVRLIHKEVRAVHAFFEAGFHNLLAVAVEERYAKEGMRAALGLLGTGQLSLTKCVVLVDEDVDVTDWKAVFGAIREHFDPEEDFLLLPGVPLDTLDFTSMRMNLGSKMVLDAMGRRGVGPGDTTLPSRVGEGNAPTGGRLHAEERSAQARARRDAAAGSLAGRIAGVRAARVIEDVMLVLHADAGRGRAAVTELVADPVFAGLKLIVAVSPDVPFDDPTLLLWGIFTRFDAARDVLFSEVQVQGAWLSPRGRMGIDATWKEGYPEPVLMPEDIVRRVDARWGELWR